MGVVGVPPTPTPTPTPTPHGPLAAAHGLPEGGAREVRAQRAGEVLGREASAEEVVAQVGPEHRPEEDEGVRLADRLGGGREERDGRVPDPRAGVEQQRRGVPRAV